MPPWPCVRFVHFKSGASTRASGRLVCGSRDSAGRKRTRASQRVKRKIGRQRKDVDFGLGAGQEKEVLNCNQSRKRHSHFSFLVHSCTSINLPSSNSRCACDGHGVHQHAPLIVITAHGPPSVCIQDFRFFLASPICKPFAPTAWRPQPLLSHHHKAKGPGSVPGDALRYRRHRC